MIYKILHIIPTLDKGGAERLVLDICNQLSKRKDCVVKIITFSNKNEYRDLTKNLDWEVVPSSVNLSILKKNKTFIVNLQKSIETFHPDIIHTHLFEAEIVSRSCNFPQAKWFSHCHDNMAPFKNLSIVSLFNKEKFSNFYEKIYLINRYNANGGNHFIAISNHTKAYFDKTVPPFPVYMLHNAIDYNRFWHSAPLRTQGNILRLINVGSISENKNQRFLLDVAQVLNEKKIDFQLNFAGEGNLRKILEMQVKVMKLEKHIKFLGAVDNVEKYLWESDIYIHSAKSEALGLTIIEAMSAGLPVITLDGKGNRDLIEQGKNGFMIFEQNPKLFADKVLEIWNDKNKLEEMSQYSQKFALKFDIHLYVEILLLHYKNALVKKR